MSLPSRSVERPVAVAMLFLAVVFLGLISFRRLPIDLLPDIAYPKLVIYTTYANVAPAEVERFITQRIESQVSAVPGVERVESVSREGISLVTLRFAWGTDMDFAALNVREKLDNLRDVLPEQAARPAVLRTDPTSEPVMALSVAGSRDLWALKDLAESVFKRRLEQIDGVAQAAVTGGLTREVHVEVDPHRLESFGLTVDDVEAALAAANASAPGGTIRKGRYRYSLRTLGELRTVEQIAEVPIQVRAETGAGGGAGAGASGDGSAVGDDAPAARVIALRDIARVVDGFEERQSIARYNGEESVGLLLFKESGANTVRVAERVEAVLDELRTEYPDIELEVATSQAGFVSAAIDNVVDSLVQGGILAFLVLFLFLRDARYPVAIGLAIPISVIGTFALLDLAGISLNIMSLGGLALGIGMLVDNSIVVLENTFRHREMGLAGAAAAVAGAEEVQAAITSSTLTTIAVFGPIIYVEGIAGELFGALSFAVAFSLLASLLVAVTLLPTMAARWRGPAPEGKAGLLRRGARRAARAVGRLTGPSLDAFDRRFTRFTAWYERVLAAALDHRGRVVALGAGLLVVAIAMGFALDRSVLPDVDQGAFRARLELPRGTPIDATARAAGRLEAILLADPEVEAVFTRVGRQVSAGEVEDEESGLNTAALDVRLAERAKTADVLARLEPRLASFPPGALAVETGGATALGSLLGGGESDLAVRVRGDDLDAALAYAQQIERRLLEDPALTNVRLGMELGQPEIQIEIDRDRAAAFGIEPRRIAETIEKYMLGVKATDLVDFDRKVPVVVRLPDDARRSLETLDVLTVDGIPLREVIRTREALGPVEIRRLEQSRLIPVYADVVGGDLDEAIEAAQAAVASVPTPRGLRVEIGGENEEMRQSFRDLAFAFALAVLLVYMILAAEFESFIHPFTILLSVPLALVGAVVSLWVAGAGLNAMSLIGIIILVGIVDNNAIVVIDLVNHLRREGMAVREAIIEACRARLRPIIMTTLTTLLGVLPMAIGIGRGADLRAPLAISIFGGLFTATALTLFVIPVAYDLVDELGGRLRGLAPRRTPATAPAPAGEPVAAEMARGD
ncbi:MAG TPA: efflux RND transporter permease subunit [Longimicrobiales bacterium]